MVCLLSAYFWDEITAIAMVRDSQYGLNNKHQGGLSASPASSGSMIFPRFQESGSVLTLFDGLFVYTAHLPEK
jgi:hypothetical protein